MKIRDLRREVSSSFGAAGVSRPLWEADLLLRSLTGWTATELLLRGDEDGAPWEGPLRDLAARRLKGEPLDYLLGEAPFDGEMFHVGPGCLIPRPESEVLVREAADRLPPGGRFLDWGAGSGCLGMALCLRRRDVSGCALEASPAALRWAWRNRRRHGLEERLFLWHGDEPRSLPSRRRTFHGVLANPPYIPTAHWERLDPSVRDHEPRCALDGGPQGLDPLVRWLGVLPEHLELGGWVLAETAGPWQVELLRRRTFPGLEGTRSLADPFGVERFVLWRRPPGEA